MAAGEWREALKLAASWQQLGAEATAIKQGWEACSRPAFQSEMGKDPAALIGEGVAALLRRYGTAAPAAGGAVVPSGQVLSWSRKLRTLRRGLPKLIFEVAKDMAMAAASRRPLTRGPGAPSTYPEGAKR